MKKIVSTYLLSLLLLHASAQHSFNSYLPDKVSYREHPLDITRMILDVGFEPENGKVIGKVTHQFRALRTKTDSVFFDAPGIFIKYVICNNQPLKFKVVSDGVWFYSNIHFNYPKTGSIDIGYEATPKKGIYFIGWNIPEHKENSPWAVRKQVWTQGQGIDNRHWIPMYDDMNDKFITETFITFSSDYNVLSNGVLKKKTVNKNKTTTWHYAMSKPHAGYLLMLAIGKYAVGSAKSNTGVPLQYWYYPEFKERMEPTFRYTPEIFSFMKEQTGVDYPWETYSQVMVQDFLYGAMENTTATIFGDFFNVDERAYLDRNYVGVNMHEFTHQWFGDFITARDARDTWLQESFATFYPKQFSKVTDGYDEWCWQRRGHQNTAIEAGKKDNFAVRHTNGGTARVYPKGAAVISMLEYILGEEQFKRVIKHYLQKHAYANVETNDLQQAIKDELGMNLDWFFDQWIYRGGEPHYKVQYQDLTYTNGTRGTEIAIEQIHQTSETVRLFKMPVIIEVHYTDGTFDSVTEVIEEQFKTVRIGNPGNKNIAYVLFDPNSNILKQVTFNKKYEELINQAKNAKYMLDRYDAIVGMKNIEPYVKRNVLIDLLKDEKNQHHAIVNEIINQLANDYHSDTKASLANLAAHKKAAVRDYLFNKINPNDEFWKNALIRALADSSYDVVKTALTKLCTAYPREITEWVNRTNNVYGMNNAVRIKWLELNIVYNEGNIENHLAELEKYASALYEFRTRINAFNTIKATNYFSITLCMSLFQAMLSKNSRLAGPAADLLNYYSAQANYRNMAKAVFLKQVTDPIDKDVLIKQAPFLNQN
ncbi:MAG: M1 family metallopeptidase [Bacteroidia bacterium]